MLENGVEIVSFRAIGGPWNGTKLASLKDIGSVWPLPENITLPGGAYLKVAQSDLTDEQMDKVHEAGAKIARGATYQWEPTNS